jgi:hypothetical protein
MNELEQRTSGCELGHDAELGWLPCYSKESYQPRVSQRLEGLHLLVELVLLFASQRAIGMKPLYSHLALLSAKSATID